LSAESDAAAGEYFSKRKNIVKQGYAACSAAAVDGYSIITADKAIAEAAGSRGYQALVISPGGIRLDGYDYGFIGGCCGLLDEKTLAFTGRLSSIKDGERIKGFCASRGVSVIELTDEPMKDIGGIIPLLESAGP